MELKAQKMGPLHLPDQIDLLLLDGGEFTSDADFLALGYRAKVIALDDTHPDKSVKNTYANTKLLQAGWNFLRGNAQDRNGWAIWGRP